MLVASQPHGVRSLDMRRHPMPVKTHLCCRPTPKQLLEPSWGLIAPSAVASTLVLDLLGRFLRNPKLERMTLSKIVRALSLHFHTRIQHLCGLPLAIKEASRCASDFEAGGTIGLHGSTIMPLDGLKSLFDTPRKLLPQLAIAEIQLGRDRILSRPRKKSCCAAPIPKTNEAIQRIESLDWISLTVCVVRNLFADVRITWKFHQVRNHHLRVHTYEEAYVSGVHSQGCKGTEINEELRTVETDVKGKGAHRSISCSIPGKSFTDRNRRCPESSSLNPLTWRCRLAGGPRR